MEFERDKTTAFTKKDKIFVDSEMSNPYNDNYDEYSSIEKEDDVIIYKLENDNLFFINNTEKNNYINTHIEYIDN
jgi:hypothetical protein